MSKNSGQKFIARNRAPRVQIEYDVEIYGSEKKIELPFVMGVISDLVGKSNIELPDIGERSFMDIDVDNFNERMKALKPRATFSVENALTNDGFINVDLEFENLEDFSPDRIAKKVEPLKELLDARVELSNLLSYMDGKTGAETLISKVLSYNNLLQSIANLSKKDPDESN